jgi:hypothetical protein
VVTGEFTNVPEEAAVEGGNNVVYVQSSGRVRLQQCTFGTPSADLHAAKPESRFYTDVPHAQRAELTDDVG